MVKRVANGEWRVVATGRSPVPVAAGPVARTSGSGAGRTYQRQRGRSPVPASGEW
ncbi:hypothetical protein [Chloracidobacterium aggregatum]|uniref:hypothetical protein n=1 Tax=Chloracidobacterium aggregatum TaxID=2851959 RepID=UPI001B8B8F5B|nr:hypothetical protein [Chloracidobacterium aggregatum]QUV98379.1 hypothetical protein J8C00_15440 [Chloracidobacterium sp. E]